MDERNENQSPQRAMNDIVNAQEPIDVPPELAAKYVEVARFVASVPEDEAIAMFVPAEDDPRLDELRRFLSFIFIGWRTKAPFYFFPKMRDEIRRLHRHHHLDGAFPECLFGRPTSDASREGRWLMPLRFFCAYASCGKGKRGDFPSLRRQMGKLLLLNALGWDVYGCPNPILYGCRIQRAIPWIVNIVAESDDATIEEQEESARRMAGAVGSVVFSGRRSLHQYYRLATPIRNPHVVTTELLDGLMPPGARTGSRPWTKWNLVMHLKRAGRLAPIPVEPFRYAADLLRGLVLERSGIQLCTATLFNFSCLARVPGFVHSGSGERARLLSVDRNAVWHDNSLGESDDVRYSPFWRQELGIPAEEVFPHKHKKCSASPLPHGVLDDTDHEWKDGTEEAIQSHSQDSSMPIQTPKGAKLPLPTHTIGATNPVVPKRTFLDDLDDFESLKATGIPRRGVRRSLHRVMVDVAKLRGWFAMKDGADGSKAEPTVDVDRVKVEWRRILSLAPLNIGCAVEEGVAEIDGFARAWQRTAGKRFRHRLPDCTKLPDINERMKSGLRSRLGCLVSECHDGPVIPESKRRSMVTGTANIVSAVLWPLVRKCPRQCVQGSLGIPAKKMKALCPRRQFGPVRDCMYRLGIIRPTRRACHAAGLTRTYFVNIPLIIWLLGLGKECLAWERHDAPQSQKTPGPAQRLH